MSAEGYRLRAPPTADAAAPLEVVIRDPKTGQELLVLGVTPGGAPGIPVQQLTLTLRSGMLSVSGDQAMPHSGKTVGAGGELVLRPTEAQPVLIADALEDYKADLIAADNSPGYISKTTSAVNLAKRKMGWNAVPDMTETSIRQYLMQLQMAGRKARTLRLYWDDIKRFAEWCVDRGMLDANPVVKVRKAKKSRTRARIVPTDEEVITLIASLRYRKQAKDRWVIYTCAANQPLRWKVWKYLQPEWIFLDAPQPHMRLPGEILDEEGRKMPLLKNRQERVEFLTPETVEVLRWHRKEFGWGSRVFRSVPKPEMFTRDIARAGITRADPISGATLSFHSLKHYASNRRMRLGWTTEERRVANDHASDRMTLDIYTNPELVPVAARTATMPPILPASVMKRGGGPKKSVKEASKSVDKPGCLSEDDGGKTMANPPVHPGDPGETAATFGERSSSCQSTSVAGRSAVLRDHGDAVQGVAQLGRASGLGPEGRWFESSHPDFSGRSAGAEEELAPCKTGLDVQILRPCFEPAKAVSGVSGSIENSAPSNLHLTPPPEGPAALCPGPSSIAADTHEGAESRRGPETEAGGANNDRGDVRERQPHRGASGFDPGLIHGDGGASGSVAASDLSRGGETESLTLPTGTGVQTGKAVGPNAGRSVETPRDSVTPRRDGETGGLPEGSPSGSPFDERQAALASALDDATSALQTANQTRNPMAPKIARLAALICAASVMAMSARDQSCYDKYCASTPTTVKCLECCETKCAGAPELSCIDSCTGGGVDAVHVIRRSAERLIKGDADPKTASDCVAVLKAGLRSKDPRIVRVTKAVAVEVPFSKAILDDAPAAEPVPITQLAH